MIGKEGLHLGHYRLVRLLGTGRFSEVYLGEHIYLGAQVALKLQSLHLASGAQERFMAEAQLLQSLTHPHIVQVRDFGVEGDIAFLVMSYASGGTIHTFHPKGQPLPLSTVVAYIQQIASALSYMHEHRVIHRDLKPENLLIDQSGQLLLGDFSLATRVSLSSDYAYAAMEGSLAYMAPEQFRGKPHIASDQYALAVIVYEWLSGTRPFQGTLAELCHAHLYMPPPPLSQDALPNASLVEQVLHTALAKDPTRRFADIRTFATALARAHEGAAFADLLPSISSPFSIPEIPNRTRFQLPLALTQLIGRDGQRHAIAALLMQPEVRLITLTGPGGIGKTSLALSIAHDLQEAFADGVCFVPLASVDEPALVLLTIAETLEQQTGNRPIFEIVQAFLHTRQFLLILDNFEQVVKAAPQLTDLLRTCPSLKLLVTSRETLHVQGEHEFPVPPLELPTLTNRHENAMLAQNDAMALFVRRVQDIKPDFRLTETNTPIVAEICVRLDGLPLALELAAARIKLLPPRLLLARLSNSLQVLTGGRQDAPARQRTLRDTIQWSYDLLSADEQILFRRLCIFVGGCTLEAIEEFYRLLGDDPAGIVDHVAQLLDKNLLKSGGQSREGVRLLLLETIREFGLSCLQERGELLQVRQVHAQYYLEWAQLGCQELFGPEQLLWMSDLLQEMGNLRTVMRFAIEQHEQEMALRLGGALGPLWMLLGTSNQRVYLVEGTQFLRQALEGSDGLTTGPRARALVLYGGLFGWIDESDLCEHTCREGLMLFQQLGDLQGTIHGYWMLFLALFARCNLRAAHQVAQEAVELSRQHREVCTWWDATWTLGYSLFNVGMVSVYDGRAAEGRAALEEGIKLCTRAGDRFFSTWSALYLGEIIALEGKKDEARTLLEQSLNASRALEMKTQESDALRFLGLLALRSGELDRAETLLMESTRVSKEVDDTQCIIWGLVWLARVKLARQQMQAAQTLLTEGVELAMSRSDILTLPACLEGWGFIRAAQDKPLWVVRLFSCAHALRETMGEPVPPIDRLEYDNLLASVRTRLDQATFQAAWAQGLNLSAEQALTEPEEMEQAAIPPKEPDHTPPPPTDPMLVELTRRELDVLRLLAEGLTNAQIAKQLVLSTVTVNSYLRAIYSKLGVSTRTAATRYALDHHLL